MTLSDLADAELAELPVQRGAADAEAAGDFGHPAAIMADGEADDVGFDRFEGPKVAVGVVEGDSGAVGQGRLLRGAVEGRAVEVAGAAREGRFLGDLREVGGGQ